jgi:hypothetical protein
VHPRPYRATTIRDEANSDGLVDLVGREFVPDGAEPIMVYRYYLHSEAPSEPNQPHENRGT